MIPTERANTVDWLRENCYSDDELLLLIDILDRNEQGDLLLLMRCYRLPPFRFDDEIAKIYGSQEKAERGLVALEAIYRPIGEAGYFYRTGLAEDQDFRECEAVIQDTKWDIESAARAQLGALIGSSRANPPVPFGELNGRLGVAPERVIDLFTMLQDRFKEKKRAKTKTAKEGQNERGLS